MKIIALLTDFGTRDPYAAALKGVLLKRAPSCLPLDLSHEIPAQGVLEASRFLSTCWPYFPRGTLFLSVVDPGVGTNRRLLAVRYQGRYFIAPDNGLLGFLSEVPALKAYSIENLARLKITSVSSTFHGRDIMAPAAAFLAKGGSLASLGPAVKSVRCLRQPTPVWKQGRWYGEILYFDHYGNAVTNLNCHHFKGGQPQSVKAGKHRMTVTKTYGETRRKLCALFNSAGQLEIALPMGSAKKNTRLKTGSKVEVFCGRSQKKI